MSPEQIQKQLEDLQRRIEGLEQKRVSQTAVMPQAIKSRHLDESILSPYATSAYVSTAIATALSGYPGMKLLTGTRDMTAAAGNVSYGTTTFTPRLAIMYGSFTGSLSDSFSFGITDGSTSKAMSQDEGGDMTFSNDLCVAWSSYPNDNQGAVLSAFTSTGVTLAWSKAGSPAAGTFEFAIVCIQ